MLLAKEALSPTPPPIPPRPYRAVTAPKTPLPRYLTGEATPSPTAVAPNDLSPFKFTELHTKLSDLAEMSDEGRRKFVDKLVRARAALKSGEKSLVVAAFGPDSGPIWRPKRYTATFKIAVKEEQEEVTVPGARGNSVDTGRIIGYGGLQPATDGNVGVAADRRSEEQHDDTNGGIDEQASGEYDELVEENEDNKESDDEQSEEEEEVTSPFRPRPLASPIKPRLHQVSYLRTRVVSPSAEEKSEGEVDALISGFRRSDAATSNRSASTNQQKGEANAARLSNVARHTLKRSHDSSDGDDEAEPESNGQKKRRLVRKKDLENEEESGERQVKKGKKKVLEMVLIDAPARMEEKDES